MQSHVNSQPVKLKLYKSLHNLLCEVKHDHPSKYSVGCENSNEINDDPVACYSPNTSVEQ